MKLPNQSKPVLRTGMESMKSNSVNPSCGTACQVCKVACAASGPFSGICQLACNSLG